MIRSIVTGGCGFIGSHLVNRLIDLGHEVIVLDRVHHHNPNPRATYYLPYFHLVFQHNMK